MLQQFVPAGVVSFWWFVLVSVFFFYPLRLSQVERHLLFTFL